MLVKLETESDFKAWVGGIKAKHQLMKNEFKCVVATGRYSDLTQGYGLEILDMNNESIAVIPINKYLFDRFKNGLGSILRA